MTTASQSQIVIRDIHDFTLMQSVEEMQREVWGARDLEIVPAMLLKPLTEVGGVLIGALDKEQLVGFAFGFLGEYEGQKILHSDMLAVKKSYRGQGIGYRLKLAQRERALGMNIELMTWTFDPLQSMNAHFNFQKLGVVSDKYHINYYGAETSSFLHKGMGTDRLFVEWHLKSGRVRERIEEKRPRELSKLDETPPLVQVDEDGKPFSVAIESQSHNAALIEIPHDINSIKEQNPELARAWREATRRAFLEAIGAGFRVEEFFNLSRKDRRVGVYLLNKSRSSADFIS